MKPIFGCLITVLLLASCSLDNHPSEVAISFQYVSVSDDPTKEMGFYFEEDSEYPNLIETFSYDLNHVITQDEYNQVRIAVIFIPHNEGGYYSFVGFYRDMDSPSASRMFAEGYECLSDATFYYSYEGGNATEFCFMP